MADINGAITQAAAPGALLRTAAEAQAQDPTKSQQPAAQPSSPIRSLTQNPIESTIPSTTPRVLNAVPVQQPNPDFTGLHAMLSSAPVPPPHVAATLIRAMMTPPSGGNGGVVAARPYVPPSPSGNAPGGNPAQSSGQPSNPSGPSQANAPVARPAGASGGFSPVNASFNRPTLSSGPSASFRSNPTGNLTPQLHTNSTTNQYAINSVGDTSAAGLLQGLRSLFSNFTNGARSAASTVEGEIPNAEAAQANFFDQLQPFIGPIQDLLFSGK